eukprot:24199-Chlamydomonas_euryale.AAC.1
MERGGWREGEASRSNGTRILFGECVFMGVGGPCSEGLELPRGGGYVWEPRGGGGFGHVWERILAV